MVWILPTRGRPKMCQETLDACEWTGMRSAGIIFADEVVEHEYVNLRVPRNWLLLRARMDMADCMRAAFTWFSSATCFGWLSDDLRPRTHEWDRLLEEAAGEWFIADCNDDYLAKDPAISDGSLCGAFCWGGKLVRTVGWWALPGVRQAGIDDAWIHLAQAWGNRKLLMDVVVEHIQWRNEKRPKDATDAWERDGVDYISADLDIYKNWYNSPEYDEVVERVRSAVEREGGVGG